MILLACFKHKPEKYRIFFIANYIIYNYFFIANYIIKFFPELPESYYLNNIKIVHVYRAQSLSADIISFFQDKAWVIK